MGALLPGVEFQLQASLGLDPDDQVYLYDDPTSLYDTAVYSGQELYWNNLGPRFLSASATRGRDKYGDRYPPGSMTVLLADEDGLFNPDLQLYDIGGQQLRPGRWVRLVGRSNPADDFVPVWTGRIDAMKELFYEGGSGVRMQLQATTLQTYASRVDNPALPAPEGAGVTTGTRVEDLLEDLSYPQAWLDEPGYIDVGVHTMQATTKAANYLELLNQAADAEGGALFCGPDGLFRFRQQDWQDANPIVLVAGAQGVDVQVQGVQSLSWDAGRVRNDVQISRVGGTAQRAVSSASQAAYQQRTYRRLDLYMETDVQAATLAQRQVDFWQWDVAEISEVELVPTTAAAALQLMQLELGDRLLLQLRTLQGWSYTVEALVQRVAHSVTAQDWVCSVVVENADRSQPGTGGPYANAFSDAYSPDLNIDGELPRDFASVPPTLASLVLQDDYDCLVPGNWVVHNGAGAVITQETGATPMEPLGGDGFQRCTVGATALLQFGLGPSAAAYPAAQGDDRAWGVYVRHDRPAAMNMRIILSEYNGASFVAQAAGPQFSVQPDTWTWISHATTVVNAATDNVRMTIRTDANEVGDLVDAVGATAWASTSLPITAQDPWWNDHTYPPARP